MFTDIKQYYSLLDSIDENDVQIFTLSNKLKMIKDNFNELESVFNTEICFNDFHIKQGAFVPQSAFRNECYPSITHFENDSYLEERAKNCKNPRFSAKYNHLIFLKTKNNSFAKIAFDKYFEQLKSIKDLTQNNTQKLFIDAYENLVFLAKNTKYKQREVIDFSKELFVTKIIQDFCFFYIISYLTKNLKIEIKDSLFFFDAVSTALEANSFPKIKENLLELAIELAQKTENYDNQKKFINQLGNFYMEQGKLVGGVIADSFFLQAMNCYKKSSNTEKLNEVSVLLQKAKEIDGLTIVKLSYSDPFFDFYYNLMINKITALLELDDSISIIEYLISGNDLFPKASLLEDFHKPASLDYITTATFDKNKNISLNTYLGFNSYHFQINLLTLEQIKLIFNLGHKNEKLNYNSLRNYFENETWYNKRYNSIESEVNSNNWLDFILPPIKMYFDLIENEEDANSNEKLILVIDSLTLKFEGALRDFLFKIGGQTIESSANSTKERISFESLLNNNVFNSFVHEDDIAFFKYLFTREGLNLRNNVAHCFYKPKDYSRTLVWLLICTFLKLGNNKFQKIEMPD